MRYQAALYPVDFGGPDGDRTRTASTSNSILLCWFRLAISVPSQAFLSLHSHPRVTGPLISGGVGEIRTHGTLTSTTPFQGVTIGHSVTTPLFGVPVNFRLAVIIFAKSYKPGT